MIIQRADKRRTSPRTLILMARCYGSMVNKTPHPVRHECSQVAPMDPRDALFAVNSLRIESIGVLACLMQRRHVSRARGVAS